MPNSNFVSAIRMPLVLFLLDSADLSHPSNPKDSLEFLFKVLSESPNITVELSAHTDYRSDAVYNQKLSFRRAKTCVDYLISSRGVDPNRISPAGYGESRPLITDRDLTTPSGKLIPNRTVLTEKWIDKNFPKTKNKDDYEFVMQQNRRVVFSILRKDYVPAGGTIDKTAPEIKVTESKSEGGEEVPEEQKQAPRQEEVVAPPVPPQQATPAPPPAPEPKGKKGKKPVQ